MTLKSFPRFEKDLDAAFKRKNIPIWITEYGNETRPGEPKGVTEAQQAAYIPRAIAMARQDKRVQMFVWFVMQDSQGSLWQSGIYRGNAAPKRAQPRFKTWAGPLQPVHGKVTVRGGTENLKVTVYLREYCANNAPGTLVGLHRPQLPGEQARPGRPGRIAAHHRVHRPAPGHGAHRLEVVDRITVAATRRPRGRPHDHDRAARAGSRGEADRRLRPAASP